MERNIFIELLPHWVETDLQPAFYDRESGTVLQQVSRLWAKVIELGKGFNTFTDDITTVTNNYIKAFNELHDYVEDYFDNLDVQEEINNKLDEMVEDGTFEEICGRLFTQKLDYYEITNQTEAEVQQLFNIDRAKVISFKNDYTFESTRTLNANTTILLNGHTLTFNVPSVNDDWENCHGFFNFDPTDEIEGYEGNGNISIIGGKIIGGNCSFAHASNITFKNVYFENCKNNHILEMCAIDGLTVEGCTFAGIPAGSSGEYIQNDSAYYSAFPWFGEDSASYDGTPCKDITVVNTTFTDSDNNGYYHYASLGTHSGAIGEDATTYNIRVEKCLFDEPTLYAIQFYNVDRLSISNSVFVGNTNAEGSCHIRLRSGVRNVQIDNNSFNGMTRAIETAKERLDVYNLNINNNTFNNYNNTTYANHGIIEFNDPIQVKINNNSFTDYQQIAIYAKKTASYDDTVEHDLLIDSNTFRPLHIINKSGISTVLIQAGKAVYSNNLLDCTDYTPAIQMIYAHTTCDSFYASGNSFSSNILQYKRDIYDGKDGFINVYGVKKRAFDGNQSGGEITSNEFTFANFNTMYATFGTGSYTQVFKFKAFDPTGKLDARTWAFPLNDGTNLSIGKIQLDTTNNKLVVTGSVNIRNVTLLNE